MASGWTGGSFSISINMSARASAGENIEASAFSALHDSVKAGIDACVHKGGTNSPTADLPMGGQKHTGAGAPASIDQYMRANEYIHQFPVYMADNESTASASATLSCTTAFFPASISAGARVFIEAGGSKPELSAIPMQLVINGSAHTIEMPDGGLNIFPGAFVSGQVHELVYNSKNHWQLMNPYPAVRNFTAAAKVLQANKSVNASSSASISGSQIAVSRDGERASLRIPRVYCTISGSGITYVAISGLPSYVSVGTSMEPGLVRNLKVLNTIETLGIRVSGNRVLYLNTDLSGYASIDVFTFFAANPTYLVTTSAP